MKKTKNGYRTIASCAEQKRTSRLLAAGVEKGISILPAFADLIVDEIYTSTKGWVVVNPTLFNQTSISEMFRLKNLFPTLHDAQVHFKTRDIGSGIPYGDYNLTEVVRYAKEAKS